MGYTRQPLPREGLYREFIEVAAKCYIAATIRNARQLARIASHALPARGPLKSPPHDAALRASWLTPLFTRQRGDRPYTAAYSCVRSLAHSSWPN